ncbi:MAG: hypothetical protein Q7S40_08325 [Opitutaceae bacterium]|nr:hypothetical protein [Opitutaceae bacterium]
MSDNARETHEALVERAIADRKAIEGMTKYEVEQAKGRPFMINTGHQIEDAVRQAGATELWIYLNPRQEGVFFNFRGLVIASSDTLEVAKNAK